MAEYDDLEVGELNGVNGDDVEVGVRGDVPVSSRKPVKGKVGDGGVSGSKAVEGKVERGGWDLSGLDGQIGMLREMADEYRPESEEERLKREKRERAKRVIASVGDGIAALGNLYYASRGAPSVWDGGVMRDGVDGHLDKLKKERQENKRAYMQAVLKLGELEGKRGTTVRELEAEREKRRLAQEKEKREVEAHEWKRRTQSDAEREGKARADYWEYQAGTRGAERDAAAEYYRNRAEGAGKGGGGKSGGRGGMPDHTIVVSDSQGNVKKVTQYVNGSGVPTSNGGVKESGNGGADYSGFSIHGKK